MNISQNKLVIKQEIEMLEAFTGFETKNKYSVNTLEGKRVFYAFEESSTAMRMFLSRNRSLEIKVIDKAKKELLSISRPFFFFLPQYSVQEDGEEIAKIQARWSFFKRKFDIMIPGQPTMTCVAKFPRLWTFEVFKQEKKVAQINKKWSGGKEFFTDADNFLIDFNDGDDLLKTVLLGLGFAVDLTYFESKKNNRFG